MWFKKNKDKEVKVKTAKRESEVRLLFRLQSDIARCEGAMRKLQRQLKSLEVYDMTGNMFYKRDPAQIKTALEVAKATHSELTAKLAKVRSCF